MKARTPNGFPFWQTAALWLLALPLVLRVKAQTSAEFCAEPLLNLNPEGHFAAIRRIDVDARDRWLVSGARPIRVNVFPPIITCAASTSQVAAASH
jgi:hypothetical protein